jgi:hypothetical protein
VPSTRIGALMPGAAGKPVPETNPARDEVERDR